MQIVNIHDAKTHLSKIIEAVIKGETVIIAKAGKPVVKMEAIDHKPTRKVGLLKGKIKIPKNFDEPMEDIISLFEGK